jgi:peroxiredoxin
VNRRNVIILAIAVVAILGAALLFLNYSGKDDNAEVASQEPPVSEPADSESAADPGAVGAGEPGSVDEPEVARPVGTGVGNIAPDFTLLNLEGEEISLSDFRGKHVYLNFWATWCSFCDMEMPDLQRVYDENDDMVVLGVNVMEKLDEVKPYVEENGLTFPVVLDEEGMMGSLYLVRGMPTTYFIDKEGVILGSIPGMLTYDQMMDVLNQMRELED